MSAMRTCIAPRQNKTSPGASGSERNFSKRDVTLQRRSGKLLGPSPDSHLSERGQGTSWPTDPTSPTLVQRLGELKKKVTKPSCFCDRVTGSVALTRPF